MNGLAGRTTTRCVAVGRFAGQSNLSVASAFDTGLSSVEPISVQEAQQMYNRVSKGFRKTAHISVPTVTLDSIAKDLPGRVHFIKVDVEGHANQVLLGANDLILRDLPDLLVEISLVEKDVMQFLQIFRSHKVSGQYVFTQLIDEKGSGTGNFYFTADLDFAYGLAQCNFIEYERRFDQRRVQPPRPGLCEKAAILLARGCSCVENNPAHASNTRQCPAMRCVAPNSTRKVKGFLIGIGMIGFRFLSNETSFGKSCDTGFHNLK